MTHEQTLTLRKGDIVTSPSSEIAMQPVRIAAVWISPNQQQVMIRVPKVAKNRWIHATTVELPETGKTWCEKHNRWEWTADHRRDHPEYYQQSKRSKDAARLRGRQTYYD